MVSLAIALFEISVLLGVIFLGFVLIANVFGAVIFLIAKCIGVFFILIGLTIEGIYGVGKILCGR